MKPGASSGSVNLHSLGVENAGKTTGKTWKNIFRCHETRRRIEFWLMKVCNWEKNIEESMNWMILGFLRELFEDLVISNGKDMVNSVAKPF